MSEPIESLPKRELVIVRMSDVVRELPRWHWSDPVPDEPVSMIVGDPSDSRPSVSLELLKLVAEAKLSVEGGDE
ncbi:hypothetical protein [Singulisphaera sp. PoT]|uniref:hypothetical protein n=1 Tax=Singulisphaera sp. PoT TaxID=3411797 RepID=UPI003BF4B09C